MTYHDISKIPVRCQVVHLIRKGIIKKSYHEFAFDLAETQARILRFWSNEKVAPMH